MLLASEDQTSLNMTWVGGDADIRHPKERARRHVVNFETIALLKFRLCDEALERRMDHFCPIKTEGCGPDRTGQVKQCPSCRRKFLFEFVSSEIVLDRHPGIRIRLILEL